MMCLGVFMILVVKYVYVVSWRDHSVVIFLSRSMSRQYQAVRPIISWVLKVCCFLHCVSDACKHSNTLKRWGQTRVKNTESF